MSIASGGVRLSDWLLNNIKSGSGWDNSYVESLNGELRDKLLTEKITLILAKPKS